MRFCSLYVPTIYSSLLVIMVCVLQQCISTQATEQLAHCQKTEHHWGRQPPSQISKYAKQLCRELLCLSYRVNHILTALKKNQWVRGMMVLWIRDTPISTAEMSANDSERLVCVKIAHHRAVRQWRTQRKQSRWNQPFSTLSYVKETCLLSPARDAHNAKVGRSRMKKRKTLQVFSVFSLYSCQYEGKWLFNILHQPPKWWGGGGVDVRVTTAAVY